jgi:HPt (histidine-containing phosphotransfer) domain-containing protein
MHAIKGSAGTIGAAALARLASRLESDLLDSEHEPRTIESVSATIPRMQQLLAASVEALTREFARPASKNEEHGHAPPLEDEDWRARLATIVALLDSSNLQAIALSETLSPHAPSGQREDFEHFLARVRALDFARASKIARDMLEQA